MPDFHSVAAQATTMKRSMVLVNTAPTNTSIRVVTYCRIETRLSTMYAWMKNWPQGVIVVPMAATTVRSQTLLIVTWGGRSRAAPPPSRASARKPATM